MTPFPATLLAALAVYVTCEWHAAALREWEAANTRARRIEMFRRMEADAVEWARGLTDDERAVVMGEMG